MREGQGFGTPEEPHLNHGGIKEGSLEEVAYELKLGEGAGFCQVKGRRRALWVESDGSRGIGFLECDTHHWHIVLLGGALSQPQKWWSLPSLISLGPYNKPTRKAC